MKFSDAFDIAFQLEKQADPTFKGVKEEYLRAAALVWNMIAAAEGIYDDYVIVDKNNYPVAFPRPETNAKKKNSKKSDDMSVQKEQTAAE